MTTDRRLPHFDAYMRFLHLAGEVAPLPNMQAFGVNERALFEAIVLAWAGGTPLKVSEAIGIDHLGSAATQHKRLARLRQMELIDTLRQDDDHRTKLLIPTAKGLEYASRVGMALLKSAGN